MRRSWKSAIALGAVALLAGCSGSSGQVLTKDQAVEQLNSYLQSGKLRYETVTHEPDTSWVGVDTTAAELPAIEKYPLSVTGNGQINLEIFSSTEKSTAKSGESRWMDEMAKQFNASGATVNGRSVSVSVRPIASGLALDYIKSGTYVPAAYSPANSLWGAMIESTGLKTELIEKRLVGNVAGILMKKDTYDSFTAKYGKVTVANAVKASQTCDSSGKCDLKLGHTDPNQSSTGLNFLAQELLTFDADNPLSPTAEAGFRKFQEKVPAASPTTDEMAKVAAKGILDAMIMESQAYQSTPALATGWVFTPAGVRHDSPLYALGEVSSDQVAALHKFADYCLTDKSQGVASAASFNQYDDYQGVDNTLSGAQLFGALDLWKANKDGGRPVISVFVIDRSGSMDGEKLTRVKEALRSAAGYVSASSYVGLVSYSSEGDITLDLPVAEFDDDQHSLFVGAVNSLSAAGGTATNSALLIGLKQMLDAQAGISNPKLRILVMSDGQQNEGLDLSQTISVTSALGVPVYGVGFEADLADLTKLSEPNEGYVINADSEDVGAKLKALLRKEL